MVIALFGSLGKYIQIYKLKMFIIASCSKVLLHLIPSKCYLLLSKLLDFCKRMSWQNFLNNLDECNVHVMGVSFSFLITALSHFQTRKRIACYRVIR